ncbi:hypothetical protein [Haloarcula rubripromontorii]|uniref:hypothetical protein n=1 Tax=Haloarcula rubripromontorii TaxID=1705562 RepID=UPI00345B880E
MLEHVPLIGYIDRVLRTHGPFGIPLVVGVLYLGASIGAAMTFVDALSALPTMALVVLYGVVGVSVTLGTVVYRVWLGGDQ